MGDAKKELNSFFKMGIINFSYQLSVISYQLSVISYQLSVPFDYAYAEASAKRLRSG
jgi:hypothetical protein